MYELFIKLVEVIEYLGYLGIFIMTVVESTFIPIPAEITLIPAGYLVAEGELNGPLVLLIATLGTVCGSLLNYYIAFYYGRSLLINYGKFFFLSPNKLIKIEGFFQKYGALSTFFGRMLPGIKHFISFPAGLGKMDFKQFCFYTAVGGFLWSLILVVLGYYIGENTDLIKLYIKQINYVLFVIVVCIIAGYIWRRGLKVDR